MGTGKKANAPLSKISGYATAPTVSKWGWIGCRLLSTAHYSPTDQVSEYIS